MEILLYILFLLLLLFYLVFLVWIIKGINKTRQEVAETMPPEYATIIIPFRNESQNILKNLNSILAQDYPAGKYEVIYINDCSEDDSYEKICSAEKPENIRVLSYERKTSEDSHKKQVVEYAIEQSKGDLIVTTDCDCFHGPKWLRTLLGYYDNNTAFISGPVAFSTDNSAFQVMQSIEFAGLILAGAGLIGINKPIICNAANLTFRKKVYKEMSSHYDNLRLSSGDDEYLMRVIALKTNYDIRFAFNKAATVQTYANENIEQFYQQRKRWASNSLSYNKSLFLSIIFLFLLSIPVQLMLSILFSSGFLISFLIAFTGKTIMEYIVLRKGTGVVLSQLKMKYFLLAELLHIPYIIITVISGAFGNFEWKNRKLKR